MGALINHSPPSFYSLLISSSPHPQKKREKKGDPLRDRHYSSLGRKSTLSLIKHYVSISSRLGRGGGKKEKIQPEGSAATPWLDVSVIMYPTVLIRPFQDKDKRKGGRKGL